MVAWGCRFALLRFYRQVLTRGLMGDAGYHFCIVRALANGKRPYTGIPEFLIKNGVDTYPIAFHRFASLFGIERVRRSPYLPNMVIFVFFAVWYCLCAEVYSPGIGLGAGLLFVVCAANVLLQKDAILFLSLSERLLARLSTGGFFLSAVMWAETGRLEFLGMSAILGGIGLITSMFARQAIFFSSAAWALVGMNAKYLLPLAAGFSVAVLLNGRFFLAGLIDQCGFSHSYRRYTSKSRLFSSVLSRFASLRALFGKDYFFEITSREPFYMLVRHPEVLLVFAGSKLWSAPLTHLFIATGVIYFLTSTPLLNYFGEAERYVDYNLIFLLPLAAVKIAPLCPLLFCAYLAVTFAICGAGFWLDRNRVHHGNDSLNSFLQDTGVGPESTVLPLPINFGQTISARTRCRVVCYPGVYGNWIFERYIGEYPLFKPEIVPLLTEFKVTHIIVDKAQLERFSQITGWAYKLSVYEKVAENAVWCCYNVRAT